MLGICISHLYPIIPRHFKRFQLSILLSQLTIFDKLLVMIIDYLLSLSVLSFFQKKRACSVIPYLKKIQKMYESRCTPFQFSRHERFFTGNQQILLYQEIQI